MRDVIEGIRPLHAEAMKAAKERQDSLVKPAGSLGRLEEISVQIAGITGNVLNRIDRKIHFVLGADNGVYEEGVAAAPQEFTRLLMGFYARGVMCGINVLCAQAGADLVIVDIGVKGELDYPNILSRKLMNGTGNFFSGRAMPRETAEKAIGVGIELAKYAHDNGYGIIGTGEVGMANTTTAAACIAAALGARGAEAEKLVGRGAGLTDEAFGRKRRVICDSLERLNPDPRDAVDILSKVGGLDIAGLCGLFIGAAYWRIPIVVDGVISIAAALLAYGMNPLCRDFMIPSHTSEEPAYRAAAERMGLEPILNLKMRLGEGTGCPIAMQVVDGALAVMGEMSTFAETALETDYQEGIHT
jgi:nicotinate-nucleotide--dimethylbenzimidazole phosphoribosyltransferase